MHFDEVYFYPTDDSAAALKRFRAGELDLVNRCPPSSQVPILRRSIPNEIKISPFVANYFLPVNFKRKPFDDLRVRQALSLALDRETLVNKVVRIGQTGAYTIVPPGMPKYSYTSHTLLPRHADERTDRKSQSAACRRRALGRPIH